VLRTATIDTRPGGRRSAWRRVGPLAAVGLLIAAVAAPASASPGDAAAATSPPPAAAVLAPASLAAGGITTADIPIRDLGFACPPGEVPRGLFSDASASATFGLAVDCLAWYDVTQGIGGGLYAPAGTVTRGQMAQFIYRLLAYDIALYGLEMPAWDGTSRFPDVPAGSNAARAVNVLSSPQATSLFGEVIVSGFGDGRFGPGQRVTREQMGTFMARTLRAVIHVDGGELVRGFCVFPDSPQIASTHRDNVHLICEAGITAGTADGTYGPKAEVTRGQMALFLMRLQDFLAEYDLTLPPSDLID
jgi:hypothetical protein